MAAFAARIKEVAISNAASTDYTTATYVEIERVVDASYDGSLDTSDTSSNDSGGDKEAIPTWRDATLTMNLVADEAGTGQEHLWTAVASSEIRAFRLRPRGNLSTAKQIFMLGIITSIKEGLPNGGHATYDVIVKRTGGQTRSAQ